MKTEWKLNASLRVTGRHGRQRLDHWEVRLCARSRLAQLRESWHSNKWRGKRDLLRIFVYGFVSCLQDMLLGHFVCIPIHFYSPITIATQFYLLGEKATAWVDQEHFSSCWRTSTLGYPLLICSRIQSRSRSLIFFDYWEVDALAEWYGCNCQPSRSRWSPSTWIHGFSKEEGYRPLPLTLERAAGGGGGQWIRVTKVTSLSSRGKHSRHSTYRCFLSRQETITKLHPRTFKTPPLPRPNTIPTEGQIPPRACCSLCLTLPSDFQLASPSL